MATNRAAKSGFAREAHDKIQSKYDHESAADAMRWVRERTGMDIDTSGDPDKVVEALQDGYVLVQLMISLGIPIGIKPQQMKRQTMPFKKMEYINAFLEACNKYGVSASETFQTVDLYESQNIGAVITCISALGRKVLRNGGPGFGVKEADQNRRTFTEEQLKAGQNVIGLQMGTNKGASQAGQNFGKARMIVD